MQLLLEMKLVLLMITDTQVEREGSKEREESRERKGGRGEESWK